MSLKVTPDGNVPVSFKEGIGFPVAVTVKVPKSPWLKVALLALVMAGAMVEEVTVSITVEVVLLPAPLVNTALY